MKTRHKIIFAFLLVGSTLISTAKCLAVTINSVVYEKGVTVATQVLKSGTKTFTLMSSRNDEMAYYTIKYELLKMSHVLPAATWEEGYTINYSIRTDLETDVRYAKGFLKLFTETGNPSLVYNKATITFNSVPSDLDLIHYVDGDDGLFRVCLPANNGGTEVSFGSDGDTLSYYVDEEVYFTPSEVASYDLTDMASKYDTTIAHYDYLPALFKEENDYSYSEGVLDAGEVITNFGSFTFTTDTLPTSFTFKIQTQAVIAPGGVYGEDRETLTNTYTI